MREEGGRWRIKSESESDRWKDNEDDGERWQKRDEDRPRGGNSRHVTSRDRSPRRRSRDREKAPRNYRNDRMVYISNIPYDVRWMELKDIVREKAGEVNFVEILEDRNGKSKGAAVVEFRDKESVQRCVNALHRFTMGDRTVVAKEIRDPIAFFRKVKEDTGIDFMNGLHGGTQADERNRRESSFETYGLSPAFLRQLNIDGPLTNRIFVANLPYNVQSGRIHDIFSLAGKVTWVDLQLDKEGRSKGMAVVQFTHPIEAVQAVSMLNNQRVFDRAINVKMDRFDRDDEKREGELPIGLRGVGMGLGANGAPLGDVSSIISTLNSTNPSNAFSSLSSPFNSQAAFPSGTAAAFSTTTGFSSAVPFQSSTVYPAAGSASYTTSPSFTPSFSGVSSGGFNVSRSIIIKNLPQDYTWQIVRDRVQQFGDVDVTEMIAPGCAKVAFAAAADAERARKALQNTTVEGRLIGVEFLV